MIHNGKITLNVQSNKAVRQYNGLNLRMKRLKIGSLHDLGNPTKQIKDKQCDSSGFIRLPFCLEIFFIILSHVLRF